MTLQELRYVVALADTGHFGHAAKLCFVSQSTLSSGLKKLEETLERVDWLTKQCSAAWPKCPVSASATT